MNNFGVRFADGFENIICPCNKDKCIFGRQIAAPTIYINIKFKKDKNGKN